MRSALIYQEALSPSDNFRIQCRHINRGERRQPNSEAPDTHKERQFEILEGLKQRVDAMVQLKKDIEGLPKGLSDEALDECTKTMEERMFSAWPESVKRGAERILEIEYELDATNQSSYDEAHDETRFSLQDALLNELEATKRNPDQFMVYIAIQLIDGVKMKYKQVRELAAGDLNKTVQSIMDEFGIEGEVIDVRVSPTDIVVVLDKQVSFGKYYPDISGIHLSEEVYSFVKMNDAAERTIRHEKIHGLIDGVYVIRSSTLPTSVIRSRLKTIKGYKKMSPPDEILNMAFRTLTNTRYYLDLLHEELLAELENAEETWRAHTQRRYFERLRDAVANNTSAHLATAEIEAGKFIQALEEEQKNATDERTITALKKINEDFLLSWIQTVETMERMTELAARLGPDATDRVHLAMAILPPSRYRHIEPLFRHLYGDERVDGLLGLRKWARNLLNPDSIEDFTKTILESPNALLKKETEEVRLQILDLKDSYDLTTGMARYSANELKVIVASLPRLAHAVGLELEDEADQLVWNNFYHHVLGDMVSGKRSVDMTYFSSMTDGQQRALRFQLDVEFEFIFEDLDISYSDTVDIESIQKKDFWKIVKAANMEKELEVFLTTRE